MAFNELEMAHIKRVVGGFVESRRPRPEVRNQLDITYTIEGQSVLIQEDRVLCDGSRILEPVAKTTWVKTQILIHEETSARNASAHPGCR